MRPVPIPDAEIWEGSRRVVFAAPNGDLTHDSIAPVETLIDQVPGCPRRINVMCALEPGDLTQLAEGGHVWVSFYGALIPFSVDVSPPVNQPTASAAVAEATRDAEQFGDGFVRLTRGEDGAIAFTRVDPALVEIREA